MNVQRQSLQSVCKNKYWNNIKKSVELIGVHEINSIWPSLDGILYEKIVQKVQKTEKKCKKTNQSTGRFIIESVSHNSNQYYIIDCDSRKKTCFFMSKTNLWSRRWKGIPLVSNCNGKYSGVKIRKFQTITHTHKHGVIHVFNHSYIVLTYARKSLRNSSLISLVP